MGLRHQGNKLLCNPFNVVISCHIIRLLSIIAHIHTYHCMYSTYILILHTDSMCIYCNSFNKTYWMLLGSTTKTKLKTKKNYIFMYCTHISCLFQFNSKSQKIFCTQQHFRGKRRRKNVYIWLNVKQLLSPYRHTFTPSPAFLYYKSWKRPTFCLKKKKKKRRKTWNQLGIRFIEFSILVKLNDRTISRNKSFKLSLKTETILSSFVLVAIHPAMPEILHVLEVVAGCIGICYRI